MLINDTTNRLGVIQLIEDKTNTQSSTSSSYPLRTKLRDINMALDDYAVLVNNSSGTQQGDDTNHVDNPSFKTNLVSGQQSYSYTVDENSNQILDIYRIECKDANGNWYVLIPYDEFGDDVAISQRETLSGAPKGYYKMGNGIFLDVKPNYNQRLVEEGEGGLRWFSNRTYKYFVADGSDAVTPTVPGIPNPHHRFLAVKPIYWWWADKDPAKASYWLNEVNKLEKSIEKFYSDRKRDEQLVITSECVNPV